MKIFIKIVEIPVLTILSFLSTRWTFTILLVLFGFVLSIQCNVSQNTSIISQGLQSQTIPLLTDSSSKIIIKSPINYFQSQVIQSSLTWREKRSPIAPGCVRYTDMIRLGESLVDKSMLIPYLFTSGFTVNLITAPRRWGKTMNIGMLKYFFQAQVDQKDAFLPKNKMSNYDFFVNKQFVHNRDVHTLDKSFLITQYPNFLESHLGNHFVIHLNFGGVYTQDFNLAAASIIKVIEGVFADAEYVVTMLTESQSNAATPQLQKKYQDYITTFYEYKNHRTVGYNIMDYDTSLTFLCKIMREQADLKGFGYPIILIDEYDYPITESFIGGIKWSKKDQDQLLKFFAAFLQNTFKNNENYDLAVITGGLRIVDQHLFTGINHFKHLNFINSDEIFFYYGFHEEEVEELFQKYNVTGVEAEHARGFYNGYKGGRDYKLSMYNPWDIACFLCDRSLKSYWMDTGSIRRILSSYSHYELYQRELLNIVTGHPVEISHASSIRGEELEEVSAHLYSTTTESDFNLGNLFRLLYSAGYLTHIINDNTHRKNKTASILAKIPNTAIKIELSLRLRQDLLETFYDFVGMYGEDSIKQQRYFIFKRTFLDYLRSTNTDTKLLRESCKNMLMKLPNFVHKSALKVFWLKRLPVITGNEAVARLVFDYTVLFESDDVFSFVGIEETFEFLGATRRIDLVLTFMDKKQYLHAVIIEYKYSSETSTHKKKETSLSAAQQCLNYTSFFFVRQLNDIKSLKCLGISVQNTKEVRMHSYYINETVYGKFTEALSNLLKSHQVKEDEIEAHPAYLNNDQKKKALYKESNQAYFELLKMLKE